MVRGHSVILSTSSMVLHKLKRRFLALVFRISKMLLLLSIRLVYSTFTVTAVVLVLPWEANTSTGTCTGTRIL